MCSKIRHTLSYVSLTDYEQLHGVTSLLEARTALQQGEQMKMLGFLATVYLPLTAAAVRPHFLRTMIHFTRSSLMNLLVNLQYERPSQLSYILVFLPRIATSTATNYHLGCLIWYHPSRLQDSSDSRLAVFEAVYRELQKARQSLR